MSGQGPAAAPKVRRSTTPPQMAQSRQGPLKAVQPFPSMLKRNNTSRSPSSPIHNTSRQRKSPGPDICTDRRSPGKAGRNSPHSSPLRRTNSLEALAAPYLKGQWPVDVNSSSHSVLWSSFMSDKGTQTTDDWTAESCDCVVVKVEKKKKKHRRSASFGQVDKKLELNSIRQKLQKTKDQGCKQRSSPVPANHNALLQTAPAVLMRSAAMSIPVHIPTKQSIPRYQRNSVEGLNPEIEQLTISHPEDETERCDSIPDGHRAPVPRSHSGTRSIDTQTPCRGSVSSCLDSGRNSESPASPCIVRPYSISPAHPIIPGLMENSPRPFSSYDSSLGSTSGNNGDSDSFSPDISSLKKTTSPKPNKIVREPPDGCEKVKFEEDRNDQRPTIKEPLLFCPIEGKGRIELKPSVRSAFCPLKSVYQSQGSTSFTSSSINTGTSIESH